MLEQPLQHSEEVVGVVEGVLLEESHIVGLRHIILPLSLLGGVCSPQWDRQVSGWIIDYSSDFSSWGGEL